MARLAATAVLLLSLLAVANCRVLEAEPETVVAISDDQSQADPAVPQETDAIPSLPTVTVAESILRLPSYRRPCRHGFLHRHLRWARNHGGAFSGPGDARVRPAFLPDEHRGAELEAVAEPDPDSRPDIEVEEVEEKDIKKPPRGDGDRGEENESVKAWKGEMLRRFRGHGLHFHHRHHHHEHAVEVEKDDSEHQEQQDKEKGAGDMQLQHVKLFSHVHHHNHGDEEQEETARKHYFHHHHDSDNEVDEVEELARKLSKAIMRRSFSRGGIRHHLHHHHTEEGGVRKWFKGLMNMNRF